ncbi:MAG TPA: tetratricopeptide repeat protein [Terriglobales bacterium]|jgi:tetratricopeptide (TPR) repeat protein|nr:tetratricopeptide repeat protein [Terriglobales bacterium]
MKAPRLGVTLVLVISGWLAVIPPADAQSRPGPRGSGPITNRVPDSANPTGNMNITAFISGKVTLEDGSELTEPAAIQTICRGDRHTRTYSDHHGGFSFELGEPSQNSTGDLSDASNAMITRSSMQRDERNWRDCEVQAVLGGFSSEVIELASRMNTLESTDVGRIVLHRMEHVEGTSISVTSALAPSGARRALEKGRNAEKKKNWNQAAQAFQKAVRIYPKYAAAWFELGRVQMMKKDPAAAKLSFERALTADAKYVPPYQGLAELAFQSKQWAEVVHTTEQTLALDPVSYPAAYFYNAVANYYLPNLDAAEKSARQGIKVDSQHQIAKLNYVLGIVLLKKQNYLQAAFYFNQYLKLTTDSSELEATNRQLAEIAKLSPGGNSDTASVKK